MNKFPAVQGKPEPYAFNHAHADPILAFTDYKGLQNTMIELVQSVVTGKAEPADALKKAAADLEQYK